MIDRLYPTGFVASDSGLLSKYTKKWIAIANLKGPSIFESVSYKLPSSCLNVLQYIICPNLFCLSPSYVAPAKNKIILRAENAITIVCFSTSWITTSPSRACISPTGPAGRELATHRRMTAISAMLRRPALVVWRRCCPRCCRVPTLGTWPLFWGSLGWKGVEMLFHFVAFFFTLYKGSLVFCCWFWLLKVAHFDGFYGFKMIWTTYDFATFQSGISLLSLRNLQLKTF